MQSNQNIELDEKDYKLKRLTIIVYTIQGSNSPGYDVKQSLAHAKNDGRHDEPTDGYDDGYPEQRQQMMDDMMMHTQMMQTMMNN